MNKKELVFGVIDGTYKSTNKVAEESGLNWYVAFGILCELLSEKKVERLNVNGITLWRR